MISIADLKRQHESIQGELQDAIAGVLTSGHFILGPEVDAFEREFAAHTGSQYGIGVNSGTSAIHLALLAAGVGPGDEVITTPFTFVATVAAIRYTGARPVLVDIQSESFAIDPELLERAATPRTKAIVPVHLYGQCADMDPILKFARSRGLSVIEDACQAHGAEYRGRRAGALGDLACFSFYPGKNLGACGEGGMITTNNPAYAEKIRMMRDWGQREKYQHDVVGFNYRLDSLQAAILRVKLHHLDHWTGVRRHCARLYNELLQGSSVITPKEMGYGRHAYHLYVIRSAARRELAAQLNSAGIQTGIHYPIPVHLQRAHADLGYNAGDFPQSESAAREVLSLPMHGQLTSEEVQVVSSAIRSATSHMLRRSFASTSQKSSKSITVIFPAYNEEQNIRSAITRAVDAMRQRFTVFELLIINDGSTDQTGNIAEELARTYPEITVVHNPHNLGLGETLYRGFQCARGELVIQNAMDYPLDLCDLDKMIPLLAEADVIVAARKAHAGYSPYRKLTSKVNRVLLRLLFKPRLRDYNYTQLYKRQVLMAARPSSRNTVFIAPEIIIRAFDLGFRITEVEIDYHPRKFGEATSGKPKIILRSLCDMVAFWIKRQTASALGGDAKERWEPMTEMNATATAVHGYLPPGR